MLPWVLRHSTIPLWAFYERSPYLRVAARLERTSRISSAERQAQQLARLQELLAHAWKTVPFYAERFKNCGFEPGDLRQLDDLTRLPVLTKQEVRNESQRLVSSAYPVARLIRNSTSGSTGMPVPFFIDRDCAELRRGLRLQRDRWSGWDAGEPRVILRGNTPKLSSWRERLRVALVLRTTWLDTMHTNEAALEALAASVLRIRPTLLFGHSHSLYLFARAWEGNDWPRYRFRAVLSTAMHLPDHERKTIERVFGAPVFDRYGCEETGLIATECEAHAGMHLNDDGLVVELLPDPKDPASQRILLTDLWNRGMPFIRYEIGDRVVAATGECACGRTYPRLARVIGRVADYLRTPAGGLVSGISITEDFAALAPEVEQVQVVQDRLDHLRVRIVPGTGFGQPARERISRLIDMRFGSEMNCALELVDRIEAERSGKYRFTICLLPEDPALKTQTGEPVGSPVPEVG